MKTAVIGAGLAGLSCARMLADAGQAVTVFDKGRGLGGRIATRRRDDWEFDHGSIVMRPEATEFTAFLKDPPQAAFWDAGRGWTGLQGASGVVKPLAEGLCIHKTARVTGLSRSAQGWSLDGPEEAQGMVFDRVVLAIPQPQALELVTPWPAVAAQIAPAQMDPCWTVMAGFDAPLETPLTFQRYDHGPIATLARERAKPQRRGSGDGWVIQAGADWSRKHLEHSAEDIAPLLLPAFFDAIACDPVAPAITMAHRWRYGLTRTPLGQSHVLDTALGLGLCGDWCLGATAEAALQSGRSLGTALL